MAAAGYHPSLVSDGPVPEVAATPTGGGAPAPEEGIESAARAKGRGGKKSKDGHSRSVRLSIDGMTCASCVAAIEGALGALDGVSSAAVSLMANSGCVEFDSRCVDVPAIVATVTALGFAAAPAEGGSGVNMSNYDREALKWRRYFLGSALFTTPVFVLSMVLKARRRTTRPAR